MKAGIITEFVQVTGNVLPAERGEKSSKDFGYQENGIVEKRYKKR